MDTSTLICDFKKRVVTRNGRVIKLSPRESKLLEFLIAHRNSTIDRKKILKHIWQYAPDIETRVVDVYMGYLRKKLDSGYSRKLIHSVRGLGYIFKD